MTGRRVLLFAIGLLVSAVFLWLAIRNTDLAEVRHHLGNIDAVAAIPYLAVLLIFFWTRACRWQLLLSPISGVSVRELFGPTMIGYAGNFLLPFQLGEVVRSAAARKGTGLDFMPIAGTIVVERLLDYLVIMLALGLSLLWHDRLPPFVRSFGIAAAAAVLLLITVTVLLSFNRNRVARLGNACFFWLPDRLRTVVLGQLELIARGFRSVRSPGVLSGAILWSLLQWFLLAVCIRIALAAVGLDAAVHTVLLIMVLLVLAISVPNAPAYIGSVQAAYVVSVEAAGGDPAQALSASLFHHGLFGLSAIVLGLAAASGAGLSIFRRDGAGRDG